MTLIELREMCAKICDTHRDKSATLVGATKAMWCAEDIRAIQLPEQEPIGVLLVSHNGTVSVAITSDKWHQQNLLRLWNSEKLRHTAKLIYEAPPSLNFSNPTVNDSLTVAALEKQVAKLETRLNKNVSLLVNETLQSENEILLKQVAELKESLRYAICIADYHSEMNVDSSVETSEMDIARERAK